jgi:3-oxoacyl-[acyl-carrier protein] reductase
MSPSEASPVSGPIDLRGKVAIVTGAARGIGEATCIALAREGADIAAVDVLNTERTAEEVEGLGRKAITGICDIGSPEQVRATMEDMIQRLGGVDILVNNAAILGDSNKAFEDYTSGDWDKILKINVRGPALVTQAVWPHMVRQGGGKIVCLGSIAGRIGGILAGGHYCASKGAIHAFVKWAAKKGAPLGIYVNGIAPGPIATPMIAGEGYTAEGIPLGRLGQPEDIAMAVVFLASQASNFITGQILDVNGGVLMV